MEKNQHWRVRDGSEKDLQGILSLRKMVFGEMEKDKLDPNYWRWEFVEGPDGGAWIYVVEDDQSIIGHFADIPRRFFVYGEAVLGTLSLDLMVHPDYWRKGMFEAMGRYGAKRVNQGEGLFMTAFPIRPETISGLKKIGWREVVDLPVLVFPINFTGIFNRYLHFKPLSLLLGAGAKVFYFLFKGFQPRKRSGDIQIEKVVFLDNLFDRFCQTLSLLTPMMGIRNRDFLTWRYLRHPTRQYSIYRAMRNGEMRGYIVLRKVELLNFNSAVIVDLQANEEPSFLELVHQGILHAQEQGADLLGMMLPKTHSFYHQLRRYGFLPSFKSFLFMIYPQVEDRRLLNPKAWYVNWGDTDVI